METVSGEESLLTTTNTSLTSVLIVLSSVGMTVDCISWLVKVSVHEEEECTKRPYEVVVQYYEKQAEAIREFYEQQMILLEEKMEEKVAEAEEKCM